MAPDNAMTWSHSRSLVWSDFKGTPPQDGAESARTGHGLYYAWACRGGNFEFRVRAAFFPYRSWVKPVVLQDPRENPRILRHEQAHFDISEVYARHMRREFAALRSPCAMKDPQLNALARRMIDEEKAMQRRYDDETNHSLVIARQNAWEADIARQLTALARWAQ